VASNDTLNDICRTVYKKPFGPDKRDASNGQAVAGETATLGDGLAGQVLNIRIKACGGAGTWIVTPTTSSTINKITFDTTGDNVSLIFDSTVGWQIQSEQGTTVIYK